MDKYIQFSMFLANKPGVLSQIFAELAKGKVNVSSIALMDSTEHGVLRIVVENAKSARPVLQSLNVPMQETDVLGVKLPNRPGAAADLCDRLAKKRISVSYMYCTSGAKGGKTLAPLVQYM